MLAIASHDHKGRAESHAESAGEAIAAARNVEVPKGDADDEFAAGAYAIGLAIAEGLLGIGQRLAELAEVGEESARAARRQGAEPMTTHPPGDE